jgi:hypothetical protein
MQCPRCQHPNSETAKFREECGARLIRACPNCGHEVNPTAKFCPECRVPLAEICGWFTEGFDTADLQEAKALLEELS